MQEKQLKSRTVALLRNALQPCQIHCLSRRGQSDAVGQMQIDEETNEVNVILLAFLFSFLFEWALQNFGNIWPSR